MSFNATVYRVLVASPSDLVEERGIISDAIYRWNGSEAADARAVLLPVLWESHMVPELGDRPQAIVNRRMVADCDLLVGAFWTRFGTPTGAFASGTLEEIEEFVRAGKPALLYFSSRAIDPDHVDLEQLRQVREARERFKSTGLVDQFSSPHELREKLARHLREQVRRLAASGGAPPATAGAEPAYHSVLITATVPRRNAQEFAAAIRNSLPVHMAGFSDGGSPGYTDLSVRFRVPIARAIVEAAVRNAAGGLGGQVLSITDTTQPGVASITGTISNGTIRKESVQPAPVEAGEGNRDEAEFHYEEYWKAFRAALQRSGSRLRPPSIRDANWVRFPAGGAGASVNAFVSTRNRSVGLELVLDRAQNAAVYRRLLDARTVIEQELGHTLSWNEKQASYRITLTEGGFDPADRAEWRRQHAWYIENLERWYAVLVNRLGPPSGAPEED